MDIPALHQLIDDWAASQTGIPAAPVTPGLLPAQADSAPVINAAAPLPEAPVRKTPEGKRVIRTKSTGDRVYLLDDIAKTKAWVTATPPKTGPDTLADLGFTMGDVVEIDDKDLLGYEMRPSIYKVENPVT